MRKFKKKKLKIIGENFCDDGWKDMVTHILQNRVKGIETEILTSIDGFQTIEEAIVLMNNLWLARNFRINVRFVSEDKSIIENMIKEEEKNVN